MSDVPEIDTIPTSKPSDTSPAVPHARPARLGWLAVLVVFLALSNAAFFPTLSGIDPPGPGPSSLIEILIGMEAGSVFAQLLILSFFAVLGPGKNLLRQGVVWLIAVALIGSFAAGIGVVYKTDPFLFGNPAGIGLLVSLFAVPAVLCACQTPLWGLRYFARWRTSTSDGPNQDLGQISIRGMLTATAVVAVVLGLCRLGHSLEALQWGDGRYGQPLAPQVWWSGIGIACAIALAVSLVVLPVTSLLVLRLNSGVLGVFCAAAYLTACAVTLILVFSAFAGFFPRPDAWPILLLLHASISGHLLISLAIFRSAGYRLWWGRPKVSSSVHSSF